MAKANIKLIYVEFDFNVDGKDYEVHINLTSREYAIDNIDSGDPSTPHKLGDNQVITADYAKSLLEKHLKSI